MNEKQMKRLRKLYRKSPIAALDFVSNARMKKFLRISERNVARMKKSFVPMQGFGPPITVTRRA